MFPISFRREAREILYRKVEASLQLMTKKIKLCCLVNTVYHCKVCHRKLCGEHRSCEPHSWWDTNICYKFLTDERHIVYFKERYPVEANDSEYIRALSELRNKRRIK